MSQRDDALEVVGDGVYQFTFVWLNSIDSNLKERHGDFMILRVDGKDIRFHPQSKQNRDGNHEVVPVRGSWANGPPS